MIGRFDQLPPRVQELLLTYFDSADDADRWLHQRNPVCGCSPLQLLEAPPGLPRVVQLLQGRQCTAPR